MQITTKKPEKRAVVGAMEIGEVDRHERIAKLAFLKAEARNFEPGHELDDWLAAERELDVKGGTAKAN